jgi:hypothetical protein
MFICYARGVLLEEQNHDIGRANNNYPKIQQK